MKTRLTKLMAGSLIIAGLAVAPNAFAAPTQGTTGTTSTGVSEMEVVIPALVKITGVADLFTDATPDYDGDPADLTDFDDVCVYSNMAAGGSNDYRVDMTGTNDSGSTFHLECTSGECSGDQIAYQAYWNDESGSNTGESAVGTPGGSTAFITGQTGWSNLDDCGGGSTARFRVLMTESALLDNINPGTYTGSLTILITPTP